MTIARRGFLTALAAMGGAVLTGCASTAGQKGIRGHNVRVIDAHTHFFPAEWVELLQKEGGANGAKIGTNARGNVTFAVPGLASAFQPSYIDLGMRLKAMDETGIDMQVLSLMAPMVYWAPPAFALKLSQVFNEAASAAHLKYPDRFVAMAMVPMHAPELAVQELERASKLPGLRATMMATAINGRNLDDKAFFPVYAKCEELGWPIFLHPTAPLGGERMRSYNMSNLLGNPVEIGIAAAALIYSGALDAFPKLDVMLPRAGGNLPWGIGRYDRNAQVRPDLMRMKHPPSAYLRRFYCDTIIEHAGILMNLIRLMGADRVMFGTDYASDNRDERPVEFIESLAGLTTGERELVLGGNAARLFKIQT